MQRAPRSAGTTGTRDLRGTRSLVDLCRRRAESDGEWISHCAVDPETGAESRLSFGGLDQRARAIAAELQEIGADADRALLLYGPGLDFVPALFGCLYARRIAVPVPPPDPARLRASVGRLAEVAADCRPSVVLTSAQLLPLRAAAVEHAPELGTLPWIATDRADPGRADAWRDPGVAPEVIAVLQYTSGSTRRPRGVVLDHRNLVEHGYVLREVFQGPRRDRYVSWAPFFHDMGLQIGALAPVFGGGRTYLMSPLAFLRRPLSWLELIERKRCRLTTGPNFAFDLCVRKSTHEERARLDLREWEVACNASEPVRAETMERFIEAFQVSGVRRDLFYPAYGLAESVVLVSRAKKRESPRAASLDADELARGRAVPRDPGPGARLLVSCGPPAPGFELVIVDARERRACRSGEVGEIWCAGESVARGYWNRPQETEVVFGGELADRPGRRFLRTGDLGFVDEDGELYVTGRLKDVIVLRGRNLYPQDLELSAGSSHDGLRPGCGVMFGVGRPPDQRLVLVHETREDRPADPAALIAAIRAAVARDHGVALSEVVLIRPRSLLKTSSGKLQRRACRTAYLDSTLELVERDGAPPVAGPRVGPQPTSALERGVAAAWEEVLGVESMSLDDGFFDLGGDSLRMAEALELLREQLGAEIPTVAFFEHSTVRALARYIAGRGPDDAQPGIRERALRAQTARDRVGRDFAANRREAARGTE